MQWMFMLIGLVLGWILDESFSDALLGALLGLGIGQAIRIARLGSQANEQRLLEQAQVALHAVEQRLRCWKCRRAALPANRSWVQPSRPDLVAAQARPKPRNWSGNCRPNSNRRCCCHRNQSAAAGRCLETRLPARPQPCRIPRGPNLIERAISGARNWLFGGNTVLRVGVVLLFLGLAFLLRYATEGMVVPIELRYAAVAAAASVCWAGLVAARRNNTTR
jgi:uncharacterized membrane protein